MQLNVWRVLVPAAAIAIAATRVLPVKSAKELAIPHHENAFASIAGREGLVAVAWGATAPDAGTDIYVAVSKDDGRTFGRPVRASDADSSANLSGEQPPSLTLVPSANGYPSIVVVWAGKTSSGTRLFSSSSRDGGLSFSMPAPVRGSDGPGNRGWQAIATGPDGRAMAIWLDHRELAMGTGMNSPSESSAVHQHGTHAPEADGAARAQLSKLMFAHLDGAGDATAVTGGVCYCCKTALTTGPDGAVYAAWRHVYPGNVRDIAVVVSRDGGLSFSPPARVSEDAWVLDGCPENGPAMSADSRQRIHVIWPTLLPNAGADGGPSLAMFYARSDNGSGFTPRQRVPTEGVPRHVQTITGPGDSIWAVWDEGADGVRRVALGQGTPDSAGQMTWRRRIWSGAATATYPVLTSVQHGIVAAWSQGTGPASAIHVERLPVGP
ncbi:MAG: exo-alpha-sialidase [Acidobacteria bacterium]|nr:exo-alpha-sialidase [Acidobacteriota bacterium]